MSAEHDLLNAAALCYSSNEWLHVQTGARAVIALLDGGKFPQEGEELLQVASVQAIVLRSYELAGHDKIGFATQGMFVLRSLAGNGYASDVAGHDGLMDYFAAVFKDKTDKRSESAEELLKTLSRHGQSDAVVKALMLRPQPSRPEADSPTEKAKLPLYIKHYQIR